MKPTKQVLLLLLTAACGALLHAEPPPDKPKAPATLYERIGGQPAIDAAVELFYKKVLADERVNHFFEDVNMKKQRAKQKAFLAAALGGPVPWKGKDMRKAHANLDLRESDFNAIAEHLHATLAELKVDERLINEVMTVVGSVKDQVLNK